MAGPFLDQAGLDALVANIKNGFLSSDITCLETKLSGSKTSQTDLKLSSVRKNLYFDYTTNEGLYFIGNGFSLIDNKEIKILKSGVLIVTGSTIVKSAAYGNVHLYLTNNFINSKGVEDYKTHIAYVQPYTEGIASLHSVYSGFVTPGQSFEVLVDDRASKTSAYIDASQSRFQALFISNDSEVSN